jgi:hypothetical protein
MQHVVTDHEAASNAFYGVPDYVMNRIVERASRCAMFHPAAVLERHRDEQLMATVFSLVYDSRKWTGR